jgi:hypothetical protein
LKKAARLIQMSAAFAKPPEQKAKQQIKALQSSAHKQALKKLLYGWATVQLAFRVMATEDFTWPVIMCLVSVISKKKVYSPGGDTFKTKFW